MKIVRVSVHSGHVFNNPTENYSNFNIGLTIEAELHDGDLPEAIIHSLQIQADALVQQHRQQIIDARTIAQQAQGYDIPEEKLF